MAARPRIIVASPHIAECTFIAEWLTAEGFEPVRASNVARVADEVRDRPFDLVVVDATFAFQHDLPAVNLVRARSAQAPIIVIGDPDPAAEAQALGRGAMFLARRAPPKRPRRANLLRREISQSKKRRNN